jgi:Coenzyme PQQ synthesis protein D (PqqD)
MFPQARKDSVLVQEIGDELIVYDQKSHCAHRLNVSAALIWSHCDGQTSVGELSALLQSRLGLPPDEEIAWLALDRLTKAHLLQAPVETIVASRRKLLQKLGFGGISLLLPAVISMVTPTPAVARGYPTPVTCCKYTNDNGNTSFICSPDGNCVPPGPGVVLQTFMVNFCNECG